jgi:hypothetical protein
MAEPESHTFAGECAITAVSLRHHTLEKYVCFNNFAFLIVIY